MSSGHNVVKAVWYDVDKREKGGVLDRYYIFLRF